MIFFAKVIKISFPLHFLDEMIMFKSRVVRIQFMVNGGFKGPVLRHKNNAIKKVEYEKIEFDMN